MKNVLNKWHGVLVLGVLIALFCTGYSVINTAGISLNGATFDTNGSLDLPAGQDLTVNGVSITSLVGQITWDFDGGGSAVEAGTYYNYKRKLPWDITLTSWEMSAPESGTCTGDIYTCTRGNWASATSITGGQAFGIVASDVAWDTDIENWGETQLSQDTYIIPVISAATETGVSILLNYTRR